MAETTAAAERPAADPRELSSLERLVANVILADRHSDEVYERVQDPAHPEFRAAADEIDWCVRQATIGTGTGPRDVAAKVALAMFYARPDYSLDGGEQGFAFPLLASALVDLLLDAWTAARKREAAEGDDEPAAPGDADPAAKPVARALELITELEQRLRQLEAERQPAGEGRA